MSARGPESSIMTGRKLNNATSHVIKAIFVILRLKNERATLGLENVDPNTLLA
ncbi:hypothetical protein Syun_004874 [Stephania yunnanensis]|uniref:Uncharacterized protein n=1 Tax=Stephania yunnanensis TaxID=152371 RepID=A0AAP0Q182_9MAGN